MSSALQVLISEGQNVLVDGEDHFPATVSLLRPEKLGGFEVGDGEEEGFG